MTLNFSKHNRKLNELAKSLNLKNKEVVAFDLPAGHTCPMADKCKATAHRITGKITDGAQMQFRCYASSIESAFSSVRNAHWQNFEAIKGMTSGTIATLILNEMPKGVKVVRIHSSGDFFSRDYFNAWLQVAKNRPEIRFFGYTKVLDYVQADKPQNFKLVYSFGGKMDSQLTNEPTAYVVLNAEVAKAKSLQVACPQEAPANDFFHVMAGATFALCLHGTQPARRKAGNIAPLTA